MCLSMKFICLARSNYNQNILQYAKHQLTGFVEADQHINGKSLS